MRKYVSMLALMLGCSQNIPVESVPVVEIGVEEGVIEASESNLYGNSSLEFLVRELDNKMKKRGIIMMFFMKEKEDYYFYVSREDKETYFSMGFPDEKKFVAVIDDYPPLGSLDKAYYHSNLDVIGDLPAKLGQEAYKIMTKICLKNFDEMDHHFFRKDGKLVEQINVLTHNFVPSKEYLQVSFEIEDYVQSQTTVSP